MKPLRNDGTPLPVVTHSVAQPVSPQQRRRLDVLSGAIVVLWVVAVISLILLTPGCTKNQNVQPAYPLHMIARDVSVGAEAFLRTAVATHGHECNAQCDPAKVPSIEKPGRCVIICNSLKLAAGLHATLNTALRVSCGGDAFLQGGPCALAADPAVAAANEAALRKALADFEKADADLKKAKADAGN